MEPGLLNIFCTQCSNRGIPRNTQVLTRHLLCSNATFRTDLTGKECGGVLYILPAEPREDGVPPESV